MRLILYSKAGCHLCEGLQEKLEKIQAVSFALDVRDITTREDWFQQYQYEVPVLFLELPLESGDRETAQSANLPALIPIPRPSPRLSVAQLEQMLQKYFPVDPSK